MSIRHGNDTYSLCTLVAGQFPQHALSLEFEIGEQISFFVESNKLSDTVHLTGNYIEEDQEMNNSDFDMCSDSDLDSMDEDEFANLSQDDSDSDAERLDFETLDSDEDDEEISDDEMPAEELPVSSKKPQQQQQGKKVESQQQPIKRQNADVQPAGKKQKQPEASKAKAEQKQEQKPSKEQNKNSSSASKDGKVQTAGKSSETAPSSKLPNGLSIKELAKGKGAPIKEGSKVGIYYTGKLTSGKAFDSKTSGKPLFFTVGKKQVIPGMEMGVLGMNYGGKRVITIPPELGYGKKALPGIPANSTLVFEITALESK